MQDLIVAAFLLFLFGSAFLIVWTAWQGPGAPGNGEAFRRLQTHVDHEQALADEFASRPSVGSLYAPQDGDSREEADHGAL